MIVENNAASFRELIRLDGPTDGVYAASLTDAMCLWAVNGGYLASIALNAARMVSKRETPVSIATDFVRPAKPGPATVNVKVVCETMVADLLEVEITQDFKSRSVSRVWCADKGVGPQHSFGQMPLVPHPSELRTLEEVMGPDEAPPHQFWNVFEQKPINRAAKSRLHRHPRFLRWFRYREDGRPLTGYELGCRALPITDVLGATAASQMYDNGFLKSVAPTAQMTTHFRNSDYAGEWLLCDSTCDHAAHGLISTQVVIWGENGELVSSGMSQMITRPGQGAYTKPETA